LTVAFIFAKIDIAIGCLSRQIYNEIIMSTSFKKSLFWDVEQVDEKANSKFIIERVLNFGDENDFQKALGLYGRQEIIDTIFGSRNLNKKSQGFWCQYFNLDPNKCSMNQSTVKQSLFWKR
jgi:hypothetical protein